MVSSNQMPSISVRGGAVCGERLRSKRQAWCNLQVKLCDPCLTALCVLTWRYIGHCIILSLYAVLRDRMLHCMFMAALCNRPGHYIFALWFRLLLLLLFFSSPNLSRRRLDVSHTSTHGVSLVRI